LNIDGTAGNAVGLAKLGAGLACVGDSGLDAGEGGQLRSEDQTRWTATDDEDVDFARKPFRRPCTRRRYCGSPPYGRRDKTACVDYKA
jgi:hypothetical protein